MIFVKFTQFSEKNEEETENKKKTNFPRKYASIRFEVFLSFLCALLLLLLLPPVCYYHSCRIQFINTGITDKWLPVIRFVYLFFSLHSSINVFIFFSVVMRDVCVFISGDMSGDNCGNLLHYFVYK